MLVDRPALSLAAQERVRRVEGLMARTGLVIISGSDDFIPLVLTEWC